MMVDKNQAVIDYLITCPYIKNSPLYFNLINAHNDNVQIVTTSEDKLYRKPYITGEIPKKYTFTLITFKSITDMAIVKNYSTSTDEEEYINENVEDLADVQTLIDWLQEQNDVQNYPNFGDDCYIDDLQVSTDTPRFDGVNTDVTPPLAMYSIAIVINYVDTSKMIWKEN
jgi:hypothetical protein